MSKYIYCNGQIYSEAQAYVVASKDCFLWGSNEWVGSDAVEFDNFEEIIEVGDLVHCAKSPDGWYESVISIAENRIDTNVSFFRKNIDEIWKRIDDTFVKVGHKVNEKWWAE